MITFLLYLSYFAASAIVPLQRRHLALREEGGGQIHFAFRVMTVIALIGLIIPFLSPFKLEGDPMKLVLLMIACGVLGALFWVTFYLAQRHVEAGIITLATTVATPVAIVLATVFLDERLTLTQMMGAVLLLVALILVSKKHRIGAFRFDRYFLLVLLSGALLGVLYTAERALQVETGLSAGTLLTWWAQVLCLGIAAFVMKNRTTYTVKDALITGGVGSLQSVSWVVLLYVVGNLSLVSSIATFKVVIVFIAAAIFLKEREDLPRKIIGSLLAVIGLLLMH
ncbi:MAG: hypothetical protein EXS51_01865 [Candidatus Taylorbacteria bacterium]|nr:hypothetical protein [Candidatus Taylorbacteria bacterium]